jgi:hypothetical protein
MRAQVTATGVARSGSASAGEGQLWASAHDAVAVHRIPIAAIPAEWPPRHYASGMDPEAPRRRPRPRPPAPPEPAGAEPGEADAPPRRAPAFAVVWWAALAIVAVVVLVAFATGTADDLPWGAIIGVLVVMAFAYAAGRRRRLPPGDDEDGSGG